MMNIHTCKHGMHGVLDQHNLLQTRLANYALLAQQTIPVVCFSAFTVRQCVSWRGCLVFLAPCLLLLTLFCCCWFVSCCLSCACAWVTAAIAQQHTYGLLWLRAGL